MSDVTDEDATRMLATCPQQGVCAGLVEFEERHDTRTERQHHRANEFANFAVTSDPDNSSLSSDKMGSVEMKLHEVRSLV